MTRLNVNLNDETAAALQALAAKRDTTLTETVRRATSLLKFIEDEVVDADKELRMRDNRTGEITTLVIT